MNATKTNVEDGKLFARYVQMRENGLSHHSCYVLLETKATAAELAAFEAGFEAVDRTIAHINPCPFCGGTCEAEVIHTCPIFAVECPKCDARGPGDGILPEAVRRWNKRS